MKKKCSRCGEVKDASLFQVRRASNDGLTAACKSCLSEYDKTRANLKHRVEARAAYQKTESGIAASSKAKARYISRNQNKRNAHNIVSNAIRDKKLFRMPCEVCGIIEGVHAHHDDYAKPLNIRWLCSFHHRQWHKCNGEALNP